MLVLDSLEYDRYVYGRAVALMVDDVDSFHVFRIAPTERLDID